MYFKKDAKTLIKMHPNLIISRFSLPEKWSYMLSITEVNEAINIGHSDQILILICTHI